MTHSGYIEGSSVLYRLDPFIKLLCTLIFFISEIIADGLLSMSLCFIFLAVVFFISGIPAGRVFSGVWRLKFFFLLIFFMNFAFYAPENAFFSWWIFSFSPEGAAFGIKNVIRVIFAMVIFDILSASTTPVQITEALETFIYPLKFIGVPVRDVAMIMGVAMQFIPIFSMEAENIKTAQQARGAPFQGDTLKDRVQSYKPLLIPVFLSAFKRADELSIAMEARGYIRKKGRLRLKKRHIKLYDIISLVLCVLLLTSSIIISKII